MNEKILPLAEGRDYYGDFTSHAKGLTLGGLYYYVLNEEIIKLMTAKNIVAIPPTSAIVSVNYMPYLQKSTFIGDDIPFDPSRFELPTDILTTSKVWRLEDFTTSDSIIGTTSKYKLTGSYTPGGSFTWQKESKLWNYPFTFTEINDSISTPLQVFPHLLNTSNITIKVKNVLNQNGMYMLYIPGYKGDETGLCEGVITSGLSLPVMSSAYMDYMTQNQHSLRVDRTFGMLGTISTGATALAKGDAMGLTSAVLSGVNQAFSMVAHENDLANTPNTLRATGGDVLFNMQVNNKSLLAYRFQYPPEIMQRIGSYFHMYGYKQNKIMTINYKSRYFYNYLKVVQCNITTNKNISKDHLNEFKQIFLNGSTIWHITNSSVTVGDYSKDNYEV